MALFDNNIRRWSLGDYLENLADPGVGDLTAFASPASITSHDGSFANAASQLNGSNQYFSDSTTTIGAHTGDFTLAGWFNLDSGSPETQIICSIWAGAVNKFWVGTEFGTGNLASQISGSGLVSLSLGSRPTEGSWHHFAVTLSGSTLTMYFNGVSVDTATLPGTLVSTAEAFNIGRFSSGVFDLYGAVDDLGFWTRAITQAEVTELYESLDFLSVNEISINEVGVSDAVIPVGDSDTVSIDLQGEYGEVLTNPEVRVFVRSSGLTVPVNGNDWNTLTDQVVLDGDWSGILSGIPKSLDWYGIEVRKSNDTEITGQTSLDFGVGHLAVLSGQSQIAWLFTEGTGTPSASLRMLNSTSTGWIPCTGVGAINMGNQMVSDHNCVVGLVNASKGGSALHSKNDVGFLWFLEGNGSTTPAPNYTDLKALVDYAGGSAHEVIWAIGDTESNGDLSTFKSDLAAFFTSQIRVDVLNAKSGVLPLTVSLMVRSCLFSVTDSVWSLTNQVYIELFDEGVVQCIVTPVDQTVNAGHMLPTGYAVMGLRYARCSAYLQGVYSTYRGPRTESASIVNSTTTDVNISLDFGSDISPTSGIDSYEVDIGSVGVPNWVVSTGVRIDANNIRLTHAESPNGGAIGVRPLYGDLSDTASSGILIDNSALAQPIFQEVDIEFKAVLAPNTGSINVEGFNPVVTAPVVFDFNTGQVNVEGFNPVVTASSKINPGTGVISVTGFNPVISLPVDLNINAGNISIEGFNPSIRYSGITRPPSNRIFTVQG